MSADRNEWTRIVRRCRLSITTKAVAQTLATYGNPDGTNIWPSQKTLAAVCGCSERAARTSMTQLRELGLIERTRRGSSHGRSGTSDAHELSIPADLLSRVHMLDPDESPASAACDSTCGHATPSWEEHRQLTTGTPATDARTPATDDRNTGTSCRLPVQDPPTNQTRDQRAGETSTWPTVGRRALDGWTMSSRWAA